MKSRKVLITTSHFHPNVGGVETHLSDLVSALNKRNWATIVACYKPLARDMKVPFYEKKNSKNIIYRMPWVGFNIVHLLTPFPPLEFIYLFPGLFVINLYALLKYPDIEIIHAQGLVPGVVGIFLAKIFDKRVLVSTHNLYFFPKEGVYTKFSAWVLSRADLVLTLSDQSFGEMKRIGVPEDKIKPFRYWIDLSIFKPHRVKKNSKNFTVFFVGRLIETKGVKILMECSKKIQKVHFAFAGIGPLKEELEDLSDKQNNVEYVGLLTPKQVKEYMSKADLVAVPSTVDEGYGRVAMEAIACGTPVYAANKGGLNEVVDPSVGKLVDPDTKSFTKAILNVSKNKKLLAKYKRSARKYALKNFSEKNVEQIIEYYSK